MATKPKNDKPKGGLAAMKAGKIDMPKMSTGKTKKLNGYGTKSK